NDLDDQLFGTFSRCQDLLRQPPIKADSRAHLRQLLSVEAGGVVFTTIQKFFPEEKGDRHPTLSKRRNIVVIADEAHRSHYDFIDGFARHMRDALPNASFIGFTGQPIARELVKTVRSNVTIDWTLRENVRAQLRVLVKRILRKYGYPPDRQEKATQTVLEQAEVLTVEWAIV
ncbi:MAG: DUF3387 domain-containing protein, partial [Syntrophorhabdaceae bacterium]|nr:DUF3387 domain-containing protein [Syntrophorhabdaceae bacterium]